MDQEEDTGELIELRTGTWVPAGAYLTTWVSLVRVQLERQTDALRELREACGGPHDRLILAAGQYLRDNGLAWLNADGTAGISDVTLDIVEATVEVDGSHVRVADGLMLRLVSRPWRLGRPQGQVRQPERGPDQEQAPSPSGRTHRPGRWPAPARRAARRTSPTRRRHGAGIGD